MTTPAGNAPAGNAPAGNAPAGNAPAGNAPAGTTGGAPAATPPWHGSTDQAVADYVKNKGWTGPGDVIKSYQGAEKLIGRDPSTITTLPKADDATGIRSLLGKLGLPETADKYEFSKPDGFEQDPAYLEWAKGAFHKVGLLPSQVKELTAAHNGFVKQTLENQAKTYQLSVASDRQALLKEWGGGHERKMQAASSAAQTLGFSAEMIDAIERTVGYAGTWKFFADLGSRLSEDSFVSPAGGGGPKFNASITPDEAKAQWDAMKADPTVFKALTDKFHPDHERQKAKQNQLFAAMYPSK